MRSTPRIPIVVFAQTPPPEHGQSRMVLLALETLRENPANFEVHHVDARFSETLESIGESSLHKGFLIARYLLQAVRLRFRVTDPLLYYVPGPVKWSSVIRDWVVLAILRRFYSKTVFHWHAIGQGEWANGSARLRLEGPEWIDRVARRISAALLKAPRTSIAVSPTSTKDAEAISSLRTVTVCNGIQDPCPDFDLTLGPARAAALRVINESAAPCFRILFISHGTVEKGLFDALEALRLLLGKSDASWSFVITIAGGVSETVRGRFEREVAGLREVGAHRLTLHEVGYVSGANKDRCYRNHEILLSPSRWESFGLTVLEAMAYSMRIVAAASDGVKGVLPDSHPYLAPTADPKALSERLFQCCSDIVRRSDPADIHSLRRRFLQVFRIEYFAGSLTTALLETGRVPAASRSGFFGEQGGSNVTAEGGCDIPEERIRACATSRLAEPIRVTAYLADLAHPQLPIQRQKIQHHYHLPPHLQQQTIQQHCRPRLLNQRQTAQQHCHQPPVNPP